MKPQRHIWVPGACSALLFLLVVCDTVVARPPGRGVWIRPGPPAHAPAYGYRHKQVCGFELVFDVGIGLYVVVGMTDVYYHEGYFYRLHDGVWEISVRSVTWGPVVIDKLPPGLQVKAKSMIKLKGNGPNGSAAGNASPPNGAAGANLNKPAGAPNANANKPAANPANKAGAPNGAPGSNAGKTGSTASADAGKSSGGAAGSSANAPTARPDTSRKARPPGKGRGK